MVHSTRYDYSKVEYQGNKHKIEIICKEHGSFLQSPSHHLSGQGCRKCSARDNGVIRKSTTFDFIEKSEKIHGKRYDYSEVEYTSATSKVKIICPKHSVFEQTPNSHLGGKGCPCCADEVIKRPRLTTQDFINTSKSVHGDKYDYSVSLYTLGTNLIDIKCREHGLFSQIAKAHMVGKGCQLCMNTGYQTSKSGVLYILLATDGTVKVGITNRDVKVRARDITYSSGKTFSPIYFIRFEDGNIPPRAEQDLLNYLCNLYNNTSEEHDGYTECFTNVNIPALLLKVSEICCKILTNI